MTAPRSPRTTTGAGGITLADKIELWPIEKLTPYERNPRTHDQQQVRAIGVSILEFGFTNPILVGRGKIRAGHGRLAAARWLGLEKVPVIVRDDLTETQLRAYLLADNRLAEDAGWNPKLLLEEVEALRAEAFDVELTGFTDEDLHGYERELDEPEQDERRGARAGKICYMLEFDTDQQKDRFFEFMAWLNARRGDDSFAAAFIAFLDRATRRGQEKKA